MRNGSLCLKLPNIQVFCGTSKIYPRHFIFRQYITTTSVHVLHTLPIKSKMMKKNHCHHPTLMYMTSKERAFQRVIIVFLDKTRIPILAIRRALYSIGY